MDPVSILGTDMICQTPWRGLCSVDTVVYAPATGSVLIGARSGQLAFRAPLPENSGLNEYSDGSGPGLLKRGQHCSY